MWWAIQDNIVNALHSIPQESVRDGTEKQIVDLSVFQIQKGKVEVNLTIPHERISKHIIERIVDVLVRQKEQETVEAFPAPQERIHERFEEQTVAFPVPMIKEAHGTTASTDR